MLKRKLLGTAAIVAALATAPAFAQTTDKQIQPAAQQLAAAQTQQQDLDFAKDAAKGGLKEVRLGELASQKATDGDVKAFGQRMVDDHSKANDQLKTIAQQKGLELPADLDGDGKALFDKLSGLDGTAFDQAYVQEMVSDHQKDVQKFQQEADGGQDPDIKAFAAQTLPTLQDHLQQIQAISTKVAQAGTDMNATAAANAGTAASDQTQLAANANQAQLRVIGDMTAEDLIGKDVVNADGKDIGEIDDLVLDQNQVAHVVVGVGGFLGIGQKDVAIPVDRLQLSGDNNAILLSGMTEDDLRNLPNFERTAYVDYPRSQGVAGNNPAATDLNQVAPAAGTTDQGATADQTQAAADQNQAAANQNQAGDQQHLQVIGDMTAEQLLGQQVVNAEGKDIGEIDDLVLDNNRLAHVVVGVGGFLGMGEKEVAIPVERLQIGDDQTTLMSAVTEDELRQLPSFEPRLSYTKYPRYNERSRVAANQAVAPVPSETGNTGAPAATADNTAATQQTANAQNAQNVKVIGDMTAQDLIGQQVVNADGRDIGEIDDLVLDNNKVAHVVVGVGGFLGIGEKDVAIPVDRLQLGQDRAIILSGVTDDDLRNLPNFERNAYAAYPRDQRLGGANQQAATDQGTAASTNQQDQVTAAARANPLGQLTADDLIGKDVVNAQGEDVGEIKDIVIDANKDKAVYVVLSVGGFLGVGDKNIVVPFDQLAAGENQAVLMNSATVDQLKGYPEWQEGATWTPLPRGKRIFE